MNTVQPFMRDANLQWRSSGTLLRALVLLLAVCIAPPAARAQTTERLYKIGFLGQTSAADLRRQIAALREGLRALGYDEGRNLMIEYRWADRKLDRLPGLATELAEHKVDAIVTHGSAGSRAAKQATSSIPIVIAVVGDPVASGVVADLARPGGNVTGLVLEEFETTVQWLKLLRQINPRISEIGWLDVPGIERPEVASAAEQKEDDAARSIGLVIRRVRVRGADDLAPAFARLRQDRVHALVVPNTSLLNPHAAEIASLAVEHRLPSIGSPIFARAGGLLAFGPDGADMYRRAAGYLDRIFKGARPAEMPMEGPAKFETIVNLKTARTLGLTIPSEILAQAHQVIGD